MNTNALQNGVDFARNDNDANLLTTIIKPIREFATALHQAQAVKEMIKDGVTVEKAYKAVYKTAA